MDGKKTGPETLSIVLSLIFLGNSPQEIEDIFEIDTDRNANFAQDLFWDLACFLQGLIQGAAILKKKKKNSMEIYSVTLI